MFNERFRGIIAPLVFGSVFITAVGTCYAMTVFDRFEKWSKDFCSVYAQWSHFPESNRTLFVALNRMDYPSAEPVVDSGAVILKILTGVLDALW